MDARQRTPLKKLGPERTYFQSVRGKVVHIRLLTGEVLEGQLRWVDRFTMCIAADSKESSDTVLFNGRRNLVLYKHTIKWLYEV